MPLTLLVIADTHYGRGEPEYPLPAEAIGLLAPEWVRRVLMEAARLCTPDAVLLMGDIINDKAAPDAEQRLADVAAVFDDIDAPILVCRGNHDLSTETTLAAFGDRIGEHHIKGYTLYTFSDDYEPDDTCTRPREVIDRFLADCGREPVIALQHNPIYPDVGSTGYPYMPTNVGAIRDSYERTGVVLSISGHFHAGQGPVERNGVSYLTCQTLCRAPYPFALVTVDGRDVRVERRELSMPEDAPVIDGHTHTHFGYCARDVHPEPSLQRAQRLGLGGLTCVEHAGQIYLEREQFWHAEHVNDPDAIKRAANLGTNRMSDYRAEMGRYRSDYVRVGIEVEVDRNGDVGILEDDIDGWDVILGAVHFYPERMAVTTQAQQERAFIWSVERLLAGGIDVLAHPFRIFGRSSNPRPAHLYSYVAKMLAGYGVAAEINYHNNEPDPEFFRMCWEENVRLVLGSDAHSLHEVGDLHPHLRLLREIGWTTGTIDFRL